MNRSAFVSAFLAALLLAACGPAATVSATAPIPAADEHELVGEASWYGPGFAGNLTASGEVFDPSEMTAAHKTLPFHTRVRVTNLDNGRTVVVRINDRGPFKPGRVIDLSRAAAEVIGLVQSGVAPVRLELLTGDGATWSAGALAGLGTFAVRSSRHPPGRLLLLSSEREPEPVLVRVVAGGVPPDAGADLLLSPRLHARLGERVRVGE